MKSAAFDYFRPSTLAEAASALAAANAAGRSPQLMAGGQSLLAMMNLRLTTPALVIDIGRLEELKGVEIADDAFIYRACVTHAAVEDRRVPDATAGMMPKVAANLAYRAVRTRGTIGGSLALCDPAADWVSVMPALGAQILLFGVKGSRVIDASDFATGIYETARDPDEIIVGIKVPTLSAKGRWGMSKFARKTGEFATSLSAAVLDPSRDYARVVLGGLEGPPIVLRYASRALKERASAPKLKEATRADLRESGHEFDDYLQGVHEAMVFRALSQVLA
jgi:aerobic carbon-monoxide dehydrogenase medium subunit